MTATANDICLNLVSSADPPGFAAVLASVRCLAIEHGITDEQSILAEAHDRWRREPPTHPL